MTTNKAAAIGVALCACGGTLFVDPNPPQLRRVVAQYSTHGAAEPLIYLSLLDLYVEDPNTCGFAKNWFSDVTQKAMQETSSNQLALATQDLAPQCTQREGVILDTESILRDVQLLMANNPLSHLRLVIVYANNLNLSLPPERSESLRTLSARLTALQGWPPLLWLVSSKVIAKEVFADATSDWTYAGDPAMVTAFRASLKLALPLQSEVGTVSQLQPLLSSSDLGRAQQFKLCSSDPEATLPGVPVLGMAATLNRSTPPAWQITLPPQIAVTKVGFTLHTVKAQVELCDGNCDRYLKIDPDQLQQSWNVFRGCMLEGAK